MQGGFAFEDYPEGTLSDFLSNAVMDSNDVRGRRGMRMRGHGRQQMRERRPRRREEREETGPEVLESSEFAKLGRPIPIP